MIANELLTKEATAYRLLKNSLLHKRVSHSTLFSGERSTLKIEAAYLYAASILAGTDDFIDEDSPLYRRIRQGNHIDFIVIDGYRSSIKTEQIEDLQEEFAKTAAESTGRKVYLLLNINNTSPKALNSLLKFMEEPKEDTYGILLTDKREDLLPTIVSRLTDIPFRMRDDSVYEDLYLEEGIDAVDAHLLSRIHHSVLKEEERDTEAYEKARELTEHMIASLEDPYDLPVLFYTEFYPFSKSAWFKKASDLVVDIMIVMLEDAISGSGPDDEVYQDQLEKLRTFGAAKLMEIFEEAKDSFLTNADRRLLFDGIAFSIIS